MTPPETITTLLFLVRDRQILLARKKRGHGVGKWNGTGGKLEPGETPEQAAVRECHEEIGVTPIQIENRGILHFTQEPRLDIYSNLDSHLYICTEWKGEPTETEEMQPQWFATNDVPYDTMWPDDTHWLPAVIAGQSVEGWFHFDGDYTLQTIKVEVFDGSSTA
jgi:8-oxo-dGTP diphosphatase